MPKEHLATEVDSNIVAVLRTLAEKEGRQFDALVEEALSDLIVKRNQGEVRPHVVAAYEGSHEKYAKLYKKVAE